MTDKISEANELVRMAEKHLKVSLFRWTPDFEKSSDLFSQAATSFKIAKMFGKSKECQLRAAHCLKAMKSYFHAAKALEQAIVVGKDVSTCEEICKVALESCDLYQQHGSLDAGANVLDKAAKIIEQRDPEKAMSLYMKATDVVMLEDGSRQAAEFIGRAARIMVKTMRFDQAADALRREIGFQQQNDNGVAIGRLTVALVLVQLARGDCVAAEKAFKEWGNYCEGPEVQTVEMLLQAYDDEDPEAARCALRSPFIRHMDVEYSHLARTLPLPQGISLPKSVVRENAAPSYVSPMDSNNPGPAEPAKDEDELC